MEGYLLKQGTYFSSWNERYFVLEKSILKQFTDEHHPVPNHSVYLGYAVVSGLFSPESNEAFGLGAIWSLTLRWPLPDEDLIEGGEWGYMHLGSYDEKQLQLWRDAIDSAVRVELTRKMLKTFSQEPVDAVHAPVEIPAGRNPKCVKMDEVIRGKLPMKFRQVYEDFVVWFNTAWGWTLEEVSEGLLYRSRDSPTLWKFVTTINTSKPTSGKRVWEAMLSESAGKWEPRVKNACMQIHDQAVKLVDSPQPFLIDSADLSLQIPSIFGNVSAGYKLDRVGLDLNNDVYLVLGVPARTQALPHPPVAIAGTAWVIEQSTRGCTLTSFFQMPPTQSDRLLRWTKTPAIVKSLTAHPLRIKEFIISSQ